MTAAEWETATAIGTLAAAIATFAAVVVALWLGHRERADTRESLRISQRLLEHAEEDRQNARSAVVVAQWSEFSSETLLGPFTRFRLCLHNVGSDIARDVQISSPEPLEDRSDGGPAATSAGVDLLAPGVRAALLLSMGCPVDALPAKAVVAWTDGNGRHEIERQILPSFET